MKTEDEKREEKLTDKDFIKELVESIDCHLAVLEDSAHGHEAIVIFEARQNVSKIKELLE